MSRRACATGAPRPREGPPGHRCHCAELTSPHFRDCARPTVCRRGGRIRMRPLRQQTASAIPSGAPASPDARQPRGQRHRHRRLLQQLQQHKVAGRRPPAELPSHPAPSPPCLRASVEGGCAKPYQNWHGSRSAREPRQRLQQQRAYAHATKQLTRGVSSINRTRRVGEKIGARD